MNRLVHGARDSAESHGADRRPQRMPSGGLQYGTCPIVSKAFSSIVPSPSLVKHACWPLSVGTCHQPIERTPEESDRDIAMMKQAGFNVVRMGDLS